MKSNSFINKIKIYSIVAFLLPLLAINSCLLLYKISGSIQVYPAFNWNEKITEITFNLNSTKSYSPSISFVDCPKYKFKEYAVTTENDVILVFTENGTYVNQEVEKKIKYLIENNRIKSHRFESVENINSKCVKNYKYLNLILNNFSFLEKILINAYENNSSGFSSIKNPYFYGEVSISRTARYFPATLIFKPLIILSAIFLFLYWKNNLNLFNELKNNNVLNRFSESFFYLGVLSCVFLILHASLLGLDFDSKLFGKIRRLIIILFILFELSAQILLTINLYKFRRELKKHIRSFIILVKITFVIMVLSGTAIVFVFLIWGNLSTEVKHIFEWNYFSILLIYYLLSRLLWKR